MRDSERAPAFILAAAMSVGIVIGLASDLSFGLIIGASTIGVLVYPIVLGFFRSHDKLLLAIALVSMVLLGLFRYETQTRLVPSNHIRFIPVNKKYGIIGLIKSVPDESRTRSKFILKAERIRPYGTSKWKKVSGDILVYYYGREPVDYGNKIMLTSKLSEPKPPRNFFAYDYRSYLAGKAIYNIAYVYSGGSELLEERSGNPIYEYVVVPVRRHIERVVRSSLSGDVGAFLEGIILGGGKRMNPDLRNMFARVGVVHILAVSGLHVGIIAFLFYITFTTIIPLGKKWGTLATILMLVLYAMVTNMRPSVLRAGTMITIVLLGQLFGRRAKLLNSLGMAALILLAISPRQFIDIGFQLSFGATFGIVYLFPRFAEWLPEKLINSRNYLVKLTMQAALVSICAQLGTFPVMTYHFHRLPILATIPNILIVPVVGIAVYTGLAGIIAGVFSLTLARIFIAAAWIPLEFILVIVKLFGSYRYVALPFKQFGVWFIALSYLAMLLLANIKRSRRVRYTLALVTIGIIIGVGWYHFFGTKTLDVVMMDVGQGDGFYIKFPNGHNMFIDGGFKKNFDRVQKPLLQGLGRIWIDNVLISHQDADHISALVPIVKSYDVKNYWDNFPNNVHTQIYGELRDAVDKYVPIHHIVRAGDTLTGIAPVRGVFISPDSTLITDAGSLKVPTNAASSVLRITYGDVSFLFTGDIQIPTEQHLWETVPDSLLDATVLKVPHHGAASSADSIFFSVVSPHLALISVGVKNQFGHPRPEALWRLRAAGADIYRTDEMGAVWLTTDGKKVWGKTMLMGDVPEFKP